MVFVPALNTVQLEMRATLGGQQIENVLYFEADAAPGLTEMNELAGFVVANWVEHLKPAQSNGYLLRELYLTDLTTQFSPTLTFTTALPQTGDDGAQAAANSLALCVSFRTAARGRGARGRNYVSGMTVNDVVGNVVQAGFINSALGFYDDLISDAPAAIGWTMVVLSRIVEGDPRPSGLTRAVTTALVVDTTVDSQRRRLPGRGS